MRTPCGAEHVLDGHRDAGERAEVVALAEQAVDLLGLAQRLVVGDGDEGAHLALDSLDAVQVGAHQLHRRYLAAL